MKKYKLVHAMPGVFMGTIFEETKHGYIYKFSGEKSWIGFPKLIVEDNPYWFELVKEKENSGEISEISGCLSCPSCRLLIKITFTQA